MINKLKQLPFWSFIALQIISFIFIILPGLFSLLLPFSIILIILEIIVVAIAVLDLLFNKNTKRYFFILWEIEFFLYILILIILKPEQTFAVEEVKPLVIATFTFLLIFVESIFLVYIIFKEKFIKKILFILASSTTIIVFLIVFFVMMEGLPAFQENDPLEFITGTRFNPYYNIDVTESITVETIVKPSDFSIYIEKTKIYISPNSSKNTTLKITNSGGETDDYYIEINSNLTTSYSEKYLTIDSHQSMYANFTIFTQDQGENEIKIAVISNKSKFQQETIINCISSNEGVSLEPNQQKIYIEKGEETIKVPISITHFGQNNDTYTFSIESHEYFRPSIFEIPWDYVSYTGELTVEPYLTYYLNILPRFLTKIEGIYQLNLTVTSRNNPEISDIANIIFDYTQNKIFNPLEPIKLISPNGTANFSLIFTDEVDGKTLKIIPKILEGNARLNIVYNNETFLSEDGFASISFNETQTNHVVILTVSPITNSSESITLQIDAIIPGTKPTLGAMPFIIGTILTTIISICIAAPLGLAVAIFLAEYIPSKIRTFLLPLYELLAGIPSVIYGLWGFLTFGPLLRDHFYPFLTNTLGQHFRLFSPTTTTGKGILTASIVLSIMILPIVITLSENSIRSVSKSLKEGSLALGTTRWQTMRNVILPKAKSGIFASIILGTGRAIGETMAVLMIMGGSVNTPLSIFDSGITMTGGIATFFEAVFALPLSRHALFAIGTILFFMVFGLNVIIAYLNRQNKPRNSRNIVFKNIWSKIKPGNKTHFEKNSDISKNNEEKNSKSFKILGAEDSEKKFIIIDRIKHTEKKMDLKPKIKEKVSINNKFDFLKATKGSTIKALRKEKIIIILLICSAILASFFIFYIIGDILANGGLSIKPEYFLEVERGAGREGGYLNAIAGSLYLVIIAIGVGAPLSIGASIYVLEYSRPNSIINQIILFTSDTLASTPSIVFGAFGFMLFVLYLDFGYSLFAAGMTLAFMIIPLMLRSSIEAIKAIPRDFHEGALALGATKWQSITTVILPPASPGIVSGAIISMGRAIGETAAVLITAGYATEIPGSLLHGAASMPNLIYKNYGQTIIDPIFAEKVYSSAFILVVIVLLLNFVARLISYRASKLMKER